MMVWVDDWQLRCECTVPFAVGTEVSWLVSEPLRVWLPDLFGDDAPVIDVDDDHHGDDPLPLTGMIVAIEEVHSDPGFMVAVTVADGRPEVRDGATFNGYLVRLEVADPPPDRATDL